MIIQEIQCFFKNPSPDPPQKHKVVQCSTKGDETFITNEKKNKDVTDNRYQDIKHSVYLNRGEVITSSTFLKIPDV